MPTKTFFNLPKEKRYLSVFSQTEKLSSKNLKDNLVSTLVFLWYYRDSFTNIDSSKIQNFISEILSAILSGKDWKIWASLNDYIPDFAEIAPETYLRLLQIQLTEHKAEICALFDNDNPKPLTPLYPLTYLDNYPSNRHP